MRKGGLSMMQEKVVWPGASGKQYTYEVYNLNSKVPPIAGNYIFARRNGLSWQAIYVGEASNFAERIPHHEKWECAEINGVTNIHIRVNADDAARRNEESDLIRGTRPPCND